MDDLILVITAISHLNIHPLICWGAVCQLAPTTFHGLHILMSSLAAVAGFPVVKNAAAQRVYELAKKLARSELPMLISGETGTGKEILARYVHENSPRSSAGKFVAINCAAIPDNLLESELFGHVKGAFTDAHSYKAGLFSIADGGTLFLDEVAEMSLAVQKKLLRAIEYQEFYPIGSVVSKKVNFRLVCATSANLEQMVNVKTFRADLYHRIQACTLTLPPLRERIDEIPFLVEYFLRGKKRDTVTISPAVMEIFSCYSWPGNIRELKNVLEYALAILEHEEKAIDIDHLPPEKFDSLGCSLLHGENLNLKEREKCFRDNLVTAALTLFAGDYKTVAKSLGTSKSALYRAVSSKTAKPTGETVE